MGICASKQKPVLDRNLNSDKSYLGNSLNNSLAKVTEQNVNQEVPPPPPPPLRSHGGRSSFLASNKKDGILAMIQENRNEQTGKYMKPSRSNKLDDNTTFENITRLPRSAPPRIKISEALNKSNIFLSTSQEEKEKLIEKMFNCQTEANAFVFKQGDEASLFFVIEEGSCQIEVDQQVKRELGPTDSFGELALLFNEPRSASVRCMERCIFWALSRRAFTDFTSEILQTEFNENSAFVQKVKLFEQLTPEQRNLVCSSFVTMTYTKGQQIVVENDPADHFFIIKKGKVRASKGGKVLRTLEQGEFFGEQALYANAVRQATITAEDKEVMCLVLGREDITEILGDKIDSILRLNKIRWALHQCEWLNSLTQGQLESLNNHFIIKTYKAKEVIQQKGQTCQRILIVLNGYIRYGQKGKLGQFGVFGEEFLLAENRTKLVKERYFAGGDVTVAELSIGTFFEIVGGTNIQQTIKLNLNSHELKYMSERYSASKQAEVSHLSLGQMIPILQIGKIQDLTRVGVIYSVKCASNCKMYLLKINIKQQIVDEQLEKFYQEHKRMVSNLCFPFINHSAIYFLEEFSNGLYLEQTIREMGLLNNLDCQFYVGSLILCLQYLHMQQIVYRDLAPYSVIVTPKGYIKLQLILEMKYIPTGKCATMLNYSHYTAPEVMKSTGYSFAVDLWSLGICFYEFMCGKLPWANSTEDPQTINFYNRVQIFEATQDQELTFPQFVNNSPAKDLISQLLNRNPSKRLGGSYYVLKQHPFFKKFNWDLLMDMSMKPPFIPKNLLVSQAATDEAVREKSNIHGVLRSQKNHVYVPQSAQYADWDKEF